MKINSITVVPRKNRPTVLGKTALELFYIKSGAYADPYQVCSVVVIKDQIASSTYLETISNGDPEKYLDYNSSSTEYGLVASGVASGVHARFINSSGAGATFARVVNPTTSYFDASTYGGDVSSASGIFRLDTGHYAVVLQPDGYSTTALTDIGGHLATSAVGVANTASSVGKYYDFWTIVDNEGSAPKVYINTFDLYNDTILGLTEPLSVTSKNKLLQKYVNVSSTVVLSIATDISLNDTSIPKDVRAIFNESVIQSAAIQIRKYDENDGAWDVMQAWADVDNVTSDDTMKYSYTFSSVGRYDIQVRYTLMDETIYSDKFNLICR